jgi:branched-chain amino acid aminotransferase
VSHKELIKSDEVFLTNTLAEILPVTLIDRRKVGSGVPGPITELLLLTYHNSA